MYNFKNIFVILICSMLIGCMWVDNTMDKLDRSDEYKSANQKLTAVKIPEESKQNNDFENYYPIPEVNGKVANQPVSVLPPGMKQKS
jgi:uncharacterized lipoprotein